MAAPFDPGRLELTAPPRPVFDGIVTNDGWGYGQYSLAADGTLLYAPGGPESYSMGLVRADRAGRIEMIPLPERFYSNSFEFSPDGKHLAITVSGANFDIWLWDGERQILSRLTSGWGNSNPVWSPDGERLIFQSDRRTPGASDFFWIRADGSAPPELLYETLRVAWPHSWSSDGRYLAYYERDTATDYDIWVLPIGGEMEPGTPRKIVGTGAREIHPEFSPDSRWLAYSSDETGTAEIYIQPFPGPGPRQQVSSGGGIWARWGAGGDEIFYLDPRSSQIMRAPVETGPTLKIGAEEELFHFEASHPVFTLSPDGEHFVFLQRGSQAQPISQLGIVFDWADRLAELFAEAD